MTINIEKFLKFDKFKKCFFGRHHVRDNFYHFVSLIFVISFTLWSFDIISDKTSTVIGMILFIVDYLAMMYDPHPDKPGTWFKAHFHRITEVDFSAFTEDEEIKTCERCGAQMEPGNEECPECGYMN